MKPGPHPEPEVCAAPDGGDAGCAEARQVAAIKAMPAAETRDRKSPALFMIHLSCSPCFGEMVNPRMESQRNTALTSVNLT
jgi:hypothetical protein